MGYLKALGTRVSPRYSRCASPCADPPANLSAVTWRRCWNATCSPFQRLRFNRTFIGLRDFRRLSFRTKSAFHRIPDSPCPDPKPEAIQHGTTGMHKENNRGELMKLSKILTTAALAAVLGGGAAPAFAGEMSNMPAKAIQAVVVPAPGQAQDQLAEVGRHLIEAE